MQFKIVEFLCCMFPLFVGCVGPILKQKLGSKIIHTPYGSIRGLLVEFQDAVGLKYVEGYFGLQYASVHSTPLRFSVPDTPKERWAAVRMFTNSPSCLQSINNKKFNHMFPDGIVSKFNRLKSVVNKVTENCLRLNIYVPPRGKSIMTVYKNTFCKL